jgi:UDP-glucose 4-epimerase
MKILITGGAGYIGSHTLKHLLDFGHDCVVLDSLVYGHRQAVPDGVAFEQVDLADKNGLKAVFDKYQFDAVVHFAAFIAVGESVKNPQKYYTNNVAGTLNLLEAMLAHHVKKLVFSSTAAVYGEPQYSPLDEKHPQNPINPYGSSKLMMEKIFADYAVAYGLKYIALRYFNASGASSDGSIGEAHSPETHLIPLVLKAIKGELETIHVFGDDYDTPDGTCVRDYIHVEDLAVAHRLALEKLDDFTGALNLGTNIGTSVKEVITAAEKNTGQTCPVTYAPRRAGDPAYLVASSGKAREILGWQPTYNEIEEIVASAWHWEQHRRF